MMDISSFLKCVAKGTLPNPEASSTLPHQNHEEKKNHAENM